MKEKIITEAIDLFSKFGFKSVTIDDIAKKMSVSKKTIYAHFPKKETLVETSVMKHFDIIIEKMMFISKHSKDPIIELYQMNKEALKYLSNEKNSPIYQLQKYYRSIYQKLQIKVPEGCLLLQAGKHILYLIKARANLCNRLGILL